MPKLLALAALLLALAAADWPQWRGPTGDGLAPAAGHLPSEWGAGKNVAWKADLPGPGSGTPCLVGGRVFFTAEAERGLVLLAHDAATGKQLWSRKLADGGKQVRGDEANLASASCSSDSERVYSFVGTGHLSAHTPDGEPVWVADCQARYGKFDIQFGAHWTPLLHAGRLYLALLHRGAQLLVCLDAKTGAEVWKAKRQSDSPPGTESPDGYASPVLWQNGPDALVLVQGNDYCTAHRLEDGKEVWRVGELNPKSSYNRHWRAVASPLATPELIVIPSCKGGVVVGLDPAKAKQSGGLIGPGHLAERWRLAKGTPDVPSPILAAGKLVFMGERGTLTVLDPATGKVESSQAVTNERHRANPVFADGKLVLVGRDGTMPVVKLGAEAEVLATNKLPDTFTASPAVGAGRIYLRGWKALYAVGGE